MDGSLRNVACKCCLTVSASHQHLPFQTRYVEGQWKFFSFENPTTSWFWAIPVIRSIDDLSESMVNDTTSTFEKVELHSIIGAPIKVRASGDAELDKFVWDEAIEECEKHWMRGPFSPAQINDIIGSDNWIASRRFGIRQGNKISWVRAVA